MKAPATTRADALQLALRALEQLPRGGISDFSQQASQLRHRAKRAIRQALKEPPEETVLIAALAAVRALRDQLVTADALVGLAKDGTINRAEMRQWMHTAAALLRATTTLQAIEAWHRSGEG